MKNKKFKSIHIDLERGIYEINGENVERITALNLNWIPDDGWALNISLDEIYTAFQCQSFDNSDDCQITTIASQGLWQPEKAIKIKTGKPKRK